MTSLKHYPYIANSDFHKPRHLHSWKTLIRANKDWDSIKAALRSNVDIAITLYRNGAWNKEHEKVAGPSPAKPRRKRYCRSSAAASIPACAQIASLAPLSPLTPMPPTW